MGFSEETAPPRRPGRPVSAEKQEAMREAAIAEFAQFGFDNASVDSIAVRAGVSKRTLYNHFPSKEALFQSLVGDVGRRISVSAAIRYSPRLSLRAQIRRFVRQTQVMMAEPQMLRLVRAVLAEHLRHPERVEPILRDYWRNEYGFLSWARAACDGGQLHGDPKKIAHAMNSMMRAQLFWPALLGRLDVQSPVFKAGMEEAVEMFLAYYGQPR